MAKKYARDAKELNYAAEIRSLKERGPERLYLLWGREDYLREQYLTQLKKLCLPEGENSFSFKRIDGPALDAKQLREAVDTLPFMSERTFVELRNADINKLQDPDACIGILSDIPEFCTVVFIQNSEYEPDGRLRFIKALRSTGRELVFTEQPQGKLTDWIVRRFAAAGKGIELEAAQRLIFVSGELMNRLIPEIEKIAAYARGDKVTTADVEAVANHIPEADIFDLTDMIAQKKYNSALALLSELLFDKKNEPVWILALLGRQVRQLYAAKLAAERKLGKKYVMDVCSVSDYVAGKLMAAARGFTLPQLRRSLVLCAETDYRMKSSGTDPRELIKEAVLRIAAGEDHAQNS